MNKFALIFLLAGTFIGVGVNAENAENKKAEPAAPASAGKRVLSPAKTTSEYSRLCEKSDIIGFWKVIKWTPYFHIPAKDWNKPAFMKFQWYLFYDNGTIKTLFAQKEFTNAEVEKKLKDPKSPLLFKFENRGFLRITSSEEKSLNEHWRCALVTRDISEKSMNINIEKGDILMTLLSKNDDVLYVRQLRRVDSDKSKKTTQ